MKKIILLLFAALFVLSACNSKNSVSSVTASPSPTPSGLIIGNGNAGGQPGGTAGGAATPASTDSAATAVPTKTSALFDPSIYVIEASGTWQRELEKGYYENGECEIYLHKIDSNDSRVSSGAYEGVFWMSVTLDADQYIKDMLKNAPVTIDFGAGAEAVCDNFGVYLSAQDDKAWVDYNILDNNNNPLPLTRETPVAKGSFVAVSKQVYLYAKGSGAQGEKLDYSDFSESDQIDVNYIMHMQPDSMESGGQREVTFFFTSEGGGPITIKGTMTRLPGYPDDIAKYTSSGEYQKKVGKYLE